MTPADEDNKEHDQSPSGDEHEQGWIHDAQTMMNVPSADRIPMAGGQGLRPPSNDIANPERYLGRLIDGFEIKEFLARGGMGMVFLAFDPTLNRDVAIKMMDMTLVQDVDASKRFRREAKATASINHPSIAQIYRVAETEEGAPYIAMEFLAGGSLLDMIRNRDPYDFSQIAALMEQVCGGLLAAKKAGIIHRDIKPANIMLTHEGKAKVVDFGLAKVFFEDSLRTQDGAVLGTPTYMSPEQCRGREVDFRSDIYSLGATFYHVLTGRPLFFADTPVQIMMKHVTAPVIPIKTLNASVPMEFDEIIGQCLRKEQEDRYQDYETLLADIQRLRLMCATREQGSFVGGAASRPGVVPNVGGSSILPPPPSGAFGQDEQPPSIRYIREDLQPEPFRLKPVHFALMAALGLIAFVVTLTVLMKANSAEEPAIPVATEKTNQKPRLAILIDRALNRASEEAEPQELLDYRAYIGTLDSLESLRSGIDAYAAEFGQPPNSINIIAVENRVLVNFETDSNGRPLDQWGRVLLMDSTTGALTSAGIDMVFETRDDIDYPMDGSYEVSPYYENLEKSVRRLLE